MNYNPYFIVTILAVLALFLIYYVIGHVGNSKRIDTKLSRAYIDQVLAEKVQFYKHLSPEEKSTFLVRVIYFLDTTKISPEKGAVITDADRVLVAASGTIPLFHFEKWAYENLDEVLVYPDAFTEDYDVNDEHRNIGGMVGTGALNHKMILSLNALRAGFQKYPSGNTGIHEFVHLIDKADGLIDGIPEYLIPKDLIDPWFKEMEKTIKQIREGRSDIRDYAATNEAEFLAVVSEYFFKKPRLLKEDHPRLYDMLDNIYGGEK
ncbi:M90 family metallopeptidase [Sphingobacterium pedocola]|uniref:Peptidase n=1 Tax=Sphingobacterium pedocola TaxID=2082722 RepID=A0ABR9TAN0_9SPHI|nr:M90 family metallopeptidase [Sphingobacterium pedocola]MBE8722149.1 peptidase [Sphingobacterium pedocola]